MHDVVRDRLIIELNYFYDSLVLGFLVSANITIVARELKKQREFTESRQLSRKLKKRAQK